MPVSPSSPSVSVVILGHDRPTLPALLAGLPPVHEVIVVDRELLSVDGVRAIRPTRAGAGNALACGVEAATGDVIVAMPATADPADIPRLLEALRSGADVVHGSRYLSRRPALTDLIVLWFLRVLFGCRPTDPGHGLRAFRRADAGRLGLPRVAGLDPVRGDGPEIDPLLAVRTAEAGLNGAEVPSSGGSRTALFPALGALIGEWSSRRRAARDTTQDSIVVMTGRVRATTSVAAEPFSSAWPVPNQHRPVQAAASVNHPNFPGDPGFVERRRAGTAFTDRRHISPDSRHTSSDRRHTSPDRRHAERAGSTDRRHASPAVGTDRRHINAAQTPGRGEMPFAGRGRGKPHLDPAGTLTRRHWRDRSAREATTTRPNLRVINGEATSPSPRRTNHLRSV